MARIKGMFTEEEVTGYLGIKKDKLDYFRQKLELPFLRVDAVTRLYLEEDLRDWILDKRVILLADTD